MRVTLSERQFLEQIRQLEGLGPEVTADEIQHRMDKFARRLFDYIRKDYGVTMLPDGFRLHGTLATMSASLKQSFSEEDVQARIEGLARLAPVSVSLDCPDLNAFVTNWMAFGSSLQRLTLQEVRPALENMARQLLSAPAPPPPSNEYEQDVFNEEYKAFLEASGKKDPLAKHNAVEEYNRAEIARVEAQRQAEYDSFRNGQAD